MKPSLMRKNKFLITAALLCAASLSYAQPAAAPLDIQGINQFTLAGVRTRAMGGTGVSASNDASALFTNPAALSLLTSMEVRGGGLSSFTKRFQNQEWTPMRTVVGLSVLFEGFAGNIKYPADTAGRPLSPWNTLQRQYDDISPNWTKKSNAVEPISFAAAVPFDIEGVKITAGIGMSQVIGLDHYYKNNNSMEPYLGQQRPDPNLITLRNDTIHVRWYQYRRSREGSVYGITPGLSVMPLPNLSVGASAAILTGSSTDKESRVDRGLVNIAISNGVGSNFMLDTVFYNQTRNGTSKYSGAIFTFGFNFQQEKYSIAAVVKPAMRLTRNWDRDVVSNDNTVKPYPVRVDTLSSRAYKESGTDYTDFPLAYTIGMLLTPTKKWTVAFDYELRNLADAKLTTAAGSSVPWVNSKASMRFGVEYAANNFLAVRGGYRDDLQPFAPDGSAIIDDPARGDVYSFGVGVNLGSIIVDLGYEYSILMYQDLYQSNINYHMRERHLALAEIAYRF